MLRRALIAASESDRLRHLATTAGPARQVAMQFVAGETLDDALRVTRELNAEGLRVTLDHLGESVDDEEVARAAADAYLEALDAIDRDGLDGSVSLKPTQLGLDVSAELCEKLIGEVADRAAASGRHVTLDMEGSAYTQATVDLVRRLQGSGRGNVGCAVQSYLHRTADDVRALTALGASLRLCKGAYAEPEEIAHQDRREIDANYARCADLILRSGTYGRFATHDHRLIARIRNLARRHQVDPDGFEFQLLYGIRPDLQRELVRRGYDVRVYVPYGTEWYPYFMRRLAERPANVAFFLRALAGRITS